MLVVPFTLEVTFSGSYAGRNWANIQHLVWDEPTPGRTSTELDGIAIKMETAWADLAAALVDTVLLEEVNILDLDSEAGQSATLASSQTGDRTGAGMPGNVAVLATKNDAHTRSQRPGRAFFVGVAEGDTDTGSPSTLNSAAVTLWQGAVQDYFTLLSGVQDGTDFYPVVLHKSTAPAGYTPYAVQSMDISSRLATQRRRLRG